MKTPSYEFDAVYASACTPYRFTFIRDMHHRRTAKLNQLDVVSRSFNIDIVPGPLIIVWKCRRVDEITSFNMNPVGLTRRIINSWNSGRIAWFRSDLDVSYRSTSSDLGYRRLIVGIFIFIFIFIIILAVNIIISLLLLIGFAQSTFTLPVFAISP